MKLTGRTAREFSKYYNKNYGNVYFGRDICFEELPIAMRYSVLVDFFETKNILPNVENLEIPHIGEFGEKYCVTVQTPETYFHLDFTNDISEARSLAIEKANKIHNKL